MYMRKLSYERVKPTLAVGTSLIQLGYVATQFRRLTETIIPVGRIVVRHRSGVETIGRRCFRTAVSDWYVSKICYTESVAARI